MIMSATQRIEIATVDATTSALQFGSLAFRNSVQLLQSAEIAMQPAAQRGSRIHVN